MIGTKRTIFLAMLLSGGVMTGCANSTKITYRQLLNFEVFDPDPAAQPHQTYGGGYSLYRIESIDNSKGDKTYNFVPNKPYYSTPSQSGWNVSWQHHLLGVPWRAGPETVASGAIKSANLGCIVVGTGGTAGNFVHSLNHNSSIDDDSVLMIREGGNTIPNQGTAFPHNLQTSCTQN